MAELRYHPLIKDWVIIASHRQARPQMPKDWCPFCPGSGKVPDEGYVVHRYMNDFPALSQDPPQPDDVATDFFKVKPAYGRCEVILYSPEHTKTVRELSDENMTVLAQTWKQSFCDIKQDKNIRYVFIFENRGDVVGVTMPHPHGQVYGYSQLPKKIALENDAASEHYQQTGHCLYCDLMQNEQAEQKRVVFENQHFIVILPFFTEYPYGVYIFSKQHVADIGQMDDAQLEALGQAVKHTCGMLDNLFDYNFPYMMCMHNAPVNSGEVDAHWHFHIEFFPPMRASDKQKFNASSETGVWVHCNPTSPEEKAQELREAYTRFLKTI